MNTTERKIWEETPAGSGELKLRVKMLDLFGEPIAKAKGVLLVDGRELDVATDADGVLEAPVEPSDRQATLLLGEVECCFELMPPADTVLGPYWGSKSVLQTWAIGTETKMRRIWMIPHSSSLSSFFRMTMKWWQPAR